MASTGTICENRKARHDYFVEERLECGLMLLGWEVKALRAGKGEIVDAHLLERGGELFVVGMRIAPLAQASTHVEADPTRTRKILASRKEIDHLCTKRQVAGYTLVPLNMHWKGGKIKIEIGLAKGKKQHDKRAATKDREASVEARRAMKTRSTRRESSGA